MRRLTIIYITLAVLCLNAISQEVTIKTVIDTNQILLGEQIKISYLITHHPDVKVLPPFLQQELTEGIELLGDVEVVRNEVDKRSVNDVFQYTITSFDTGVYYLPPQPFLLEFEGMTDTLFSKATYLEVFGVEVDTTNTIRDIKDVEHVPIRFKDVYPYILVILILGVGGFFLIKYLTRDKVEGESIIKRNKPIEPPYFIALRELDKLKTEKLWQQNQIKEYYSRLSSIIRGYIEKRYVFPALEQTTYEILREFRSKYQGEKIDYEILQELLNLSDLVKFAKGEPLPEDNVRLLENAYKFVKDTKAEIIEEENAQKD